MSTSYLTDAFRSLSTSTALLNSLPLSSSNILPRTVLSNEDFFETHLIRDAAPHELALFQPNAATSDFDAGGAVVDEGWLREQQGGETGWGVRKRQGPVRVGAREKASPLKSARRQTQQGGGGVDEPDRCLRAAKKLLDVYTMPRATDHVLALHSQWVGLVDSISDLEESLRRPPSRPTPQPHHSDSYYRRLEFEDLIKREQLELLALEEIKAEKQAEVHALLRRPSTSSRPDIPPSPARRPVAPTAKGRRVPSVVSSARARPPPSINDTYTLLDEQDPNFDPFAKSTELVKPAALSPQVEGQPETNQKRVPAVVAAAAAARGRPSTGAPPSATARSPPARASAPPSRGKTPMTAAPPAPSAEEETEQAQEPTPKPARTRSSRPSLPASASASIAPPPPPPPPPPPSIAQPQPSPTLPEGVSEAELDLALKTIWSGLGEVSGLKGWGRRRGEEKGGMEEEEMRGRMERGEVGVEETIEILSYALSTSSASLSSTPASPGSSIATATTSSTTTNDPPAFWTPAQLLESHLLILLLSSLAPSPSSSSSTSLPLPLIFRSPLATGLSTQKTPCVSMTLVKTRLGEFAREKGWTEEMGTTAVYALVSKGIVRIDRRGKEGAAVGIRT
ncbi:hypothetical protein JCM11641_000766 [Rhodosporidiobolus odoratus]